MVSNDIPLLSWIHSEPQVGRFGCVGFSIDQQHAEPITIDMIFADLDKILGVLTER